MKNRPALLALIPFSLTIAACDNDKGTRPGEGPQERNTPPTTPGSSADPGNAGSRGGSTGGPSSGGIGSPSKPPETQEAPSR